MASVTGTQIQHIDYSFDSDNAEESCWELVQRLSPLFKEIQREHIHFNPFTEGITNTIIKVTSQPPGESNESADRNAILVRAYGSGTDTMIDRAKELRVHGMLAEKGLASSVRASFNNGFMVNWISCDHMDLTH
jgi:ethanolamine kinase